MYILCGLVVYILHIDMQSTIQENLCWAQFYMKTNIHSTNDNYQTIEVFEINRCYLIKHIECAATRRSVCGVFLFIGVFFSHGLNWFAITSLYPNGQLFAHFGIH